MRPLRQRISENALATPQPRGLSRTKAAEYLGIAGWALRVLIWNGELKPICVGRRDIFDRLDLDEWFEKRKAAGDM